MKAIVGNVSKNDNVKPFVFIFISGIVSVISSLGAPLIPEISNYYGISPVLGKWSLTIALIASAVSTPIFAKLSDFGHYKTVVLTTLIATTVGCMLSSFTSNFYVFLVGRALQGIGLGIIPSLIIAANKMLPNSRKTISALSVATAVGLGIGYPLSGVLTTFVNLKFTFLMGGIFSLFAAIMSLQLINIKEDTRKTFDLLGAVLITLILTLLILLFNALESNAGIKSTLAYFIGFCLLLLLWIKLEAKTKNPLISIRVIKLPESLIVNAISILSGSIIYILITASMLLVQQTSTPGLSETALMAGLVLVPFSLATLISRYITLNHLSSYTKALVGSLFLFLSIIAFMLINGKIIFEFISMALCGYGIGLIFGSIPHIIKDNLNKSDAAEAFSLNQLSRSVGYSIGSVLSVNIISMFFLNDAGEPSKASYRLLAITSLIITLLLSALIIVCYKRFCAQTKNTLR